MEFVYVLLVEDGAEWEDLVIFVTEEEALRMSIQYPKHRVEVFRRKQDHGGFEPTYTYIKNGKYVQNTV